MNIKHMVSKNLLEILDIELKFNNEIEDIEENGWFQSPLAIMLKYRMQILAIAKIMPLYNIVYIRHDRNSTDYDAHYGEYEIYKCTETSHMVIGNPFGPVKPSSWGAAMHHTVQ